MAPFRCVGTQGHEGENSGSHPHATSEHRVFPPFSGDLKVDEKLKLSNVDFKQTVKDFLKCEFVTPLSQLTATAAFPTPHVLAQFASKAYTDYKTGETDAQYETRLALPDSWKLLTTACNSRKNNGYFGAAYWHPENQQVVIAHRGTKLTNLGALWTDTFGVFLKKLVPQMGSASTFAHKVVVVLREVNQEKGPIFQVFFTGHSLGGWLAQITTLSTKYLKIQENNFLKISHVSQSFHPHTVVFDSPGCKDMLSEMTDKVDVRLHGRSIDIEHLDITSYLSAPNLINTCNAHLGTVYRIFTDLSEMAWWKKYTALYTLEAHSMDKILQVFDPETGNVLKNEEGKLKIQLVVDWPVTVGLSRGKEYKRFFKWAKHLSNYHTEIAVENSLIKGYYPIRYQTKNYDEQVTSVSIFSEEEFQFLEDYRRICQLPELYKTTEMFSEMGNNQTQKESEKRLQCFQFEKQTVRCTDGSALQALIPYVKRLLALFPQIKENIKCALSPHEIRNNVYQIGTKHYLETFQQNPLDFKPNALCLGNFLSSEEQKVLQLRMVDGDAWTGLIKVYQVLAKTDCLSEGHYTILALENLLLVNHLVNLNTLLQSTTAPHLLMMSCETIQLLNDETKQIIRSLFHSLRQKQNVKIILTTQSDDDTVTSLQDIAKETLSNGFVTIDEQIIWSDLTSSSQEKLFECIVNFQGSEIALNQLISPDSLVTDCLPLADFLRKRHLKIGAGLELNCDHNYYDARYFIDRTFTHQVAVKHDFLNDHRDKEFPDLLASSEQEFKQLCQLNPKCNVHWLEKHKAGNLLLKKTQGSVQTLRKYIDTDSSHTYTPDDLDKLLEQAVHQRVMLISDTAGMGKSTVLTHLSKRIKETFPTKWVERIDLNDHTDALTTLEKEQIDKERAIEFVSEKLLKLEPGVELEVFKQSCEEKQKVRIIIMLDAFDEISPKYKQTVIDLLQALRQTAVEQLWVTTRPHLREELEENLQQLSYTLEPFSEKNQVEFLLKFWCLKDWFIEAGSEVEEEFKTKLEIYAKHLIRKLTKSISDKDRQFTGIPLQCRMLAEAFDKEVKVFCQSTEFVPELPFKLDLLGLYEIFTNRKYDICVEEKFKFLMTNVAVEELRKQWVKTNIENHQILALKMLLTVEELALLHIDSQCTSVDENLIRTGIVQTGNKGKLHFIHRTFAEFYVADYFVNELTKGSYISQQIQDVLLQKIFLEEEYRVIRAFIDGLLSRSKPPNEVIKQYGNRINDLGKDDLLTLHTAACEGNAHIIGFLLDSLKETGKADTWVKLLLARDYDSHTVWHVAAKKGQLEVLHKLWEWAKEVLTQEELNNMFLAKDEFERTAWHMAAERGQLEVLHKLWEWAKKVLTTEELIKKLFLDQDLVGRTAWYVAAEKGKLEVLHRQWELIKEVLTPEESRQLLLTNDNFRSIGWHIAAEKGQLQALNKMWECAKEVLTPEELSNKLFLAKDEDNRTTWYVAAEKGKLDILHKLWEWAKEVLTPEELKKLFFARGKGERATWHAAAKKGKLVILHKMWEWAKEVLTSEELHNMFLAKDRDERTVWHVAAKKGQLEVLHKVWEWAKEILPPEEINKLFLAKDKFGKTAWHMASERSHPEILCTVWECAKEVLTPEEINKFFLAKDDGQKTAWYMAVEKGKLQLLHSLWEWAKEVLTSEELNKLFLANHHGKSTVWLVAAQKGHLEVLKNVWAWSKEVLTPEELNNNMILAKDNCDRTAWHMATGKGQLEILHKVWEWAKEVLTPEELNNKLLLAKDISGRTAWYVAAENGKLQLLSNLWELAKGVLTPEELNKMFLAKDIYLKTAWHVAAENGELDILQKLWEWAKEVLTPDELNNKLFLAKDIWGRTAWYVAAENGKLQLLSNLWELAKWVLTPEELNNKMFLAKDIKLKTAWHVAAENGKLDVLQKLWEWAKEVLTPEELNNKMFLAKDIKLKTVWHVAAENGDLDILQKL